MNLNGLGGADSFAAPSLVALGFIRHFAFLAGFIKIQNLLRAKLDALSAADTKILIY
jgi:hypothetical protein